MSSEIWLSDDSGAPRALFSIGQTIFVAGRGLRPRTLYDFRLLSQEDRGKHQLLARYTTDRYGELAATSVLPYVGLVHHTATRTRSYDEAFESMEGRTLAIRVTRRRKGKPEFEDLTFSIAPRDGEPRLFSCDSRGRLQTGIEQDAGQVAVALHNFRAGCVRIFLVRRQFGWRIGDPIEPASTRDGAAGIRTFNHDGSATRIVVITNSSELEPGSYQFIARTFPVGWYEADEQSLLPGDVLSDRRFASLVIRLPFNKLFDYDNGIVLTPEIAGRPLAHRPYFRFVNNFPKGTDVYAALDPDALPPGIVGQRAAINDAKLTADAV